MPPTFFIKRGDRRPTFKAQLLADGVAATGLTLLTPARFIMRRADADPASPPKISAAAAVLDATLAIVQYSWAVGDTDEDGDYNGEIEITWPDGTTETWPSGDDTAADLYYPITVLPDLDQI
jgi:hypothetical protein